MFEIRLQPDQADGLPYFNRSQNKIEFSREQHLLVANMPEEQFEKFLRDNNLIVYHNMLKGYEDGEIYGEFSVRDLPG
ncbi:MAG: hypothetical protein H0Z33_06210 [Bacillaceae bacterium]|nr:hypothetical protein [Bacillaceae bacterium]